jgi:8-oxo-dGTP pyrophosphatase MutT (NUDIX family)
MASSFRIPPGYTPDMSQARVGGVLIALYPLNGNVHTVLMKRPDYIGAHSGQVSFPGGKKEPNDPDIVTTALREAQEEVAISPQDVQVLGQLTELYIPASNFLVHPVIGLLDHVPHLIPDAHEVERILLPNLAHFLRSDIVGEKVIPIRENLTVRAPYYDVEGQTVWGATAMIISEFAQVLRDIGFSGQNRP